MESLDESIKKVQKKMSMEVFDTNQIQCDIGEVLDTFDSSLDQDLPPLPSQGFTKLDTLIKKKRDEEWGQLKQDVSNLRRHLKKSLNELVTDLEDLKFRLKSLAVEVRCGFECEIDAF